MLWNYLWYSNFKYVFCQLLGPGSLNLGRRGLLATVEDWSLVAGMWCLAVIEKSPGLRAVSFILDSGVSSGCRRTEIKHTKKNSQKSFV